MEMRVSILNIVSNEREEPTVGAEAPVIDRLGDFVANPEKYNLFFPPV